jgi:hypothetical protein
MQLLHDLQRDPPSGMIRPIGVKPDGSKADRMVAQSAKIEAGHVHLPCDANWLDNFLLEILGFPQGRHDDQVDSVSQFLKWASSRAYCDDDVGAVFGRCALPCLPLQLVKSNPPAQVGWSGAGLR